MTPPRSPSPDPAGSAASPVDVTGSADQAARTRPLVVAVIGAGAIGSAVIEALERGDVPGARLGDVLRSRSTDEEITDAIEVADVVVEAGSIEAAEEFIPRVTASGKDIIVCSCGVFARHSDLRELLAGGPVSGRVLVPAGAVGGLDILSAAALAGTDDALLRHYTIKSPAALDVDEQLTERREVFRGSAREAALAFPLTSNASVALALATLGLDRTEVVVVADPEVRRTRHVVEWVSPMGRYELQFENAVDPDSGGRTSTITAWSVAEVLASLTTGAGPGVVVLSQDPGRGSRREAKDRPVTGRPVEARPPSP
ncbi:aspartate dehydrogenase domain-containing protein [Dietzia maris]|uniref:L-aspartate dehydrogenase n=1 Tax=Dietzia maris TaxID=37915 RepID=A0AAE4QXX7_9ACTN|nr:aspartate dehydrogenase domain-containing protein [Dietzia maris]MDV6298493.1 aspartate dehydrogenase domain-containing protein [Dietzia maris]